jgi:hypothetical protein
MWLLVEMVGSGCGPLRYLRVGRERPIEEEQNESWWRSCASELRVVWRSARGVLEAVPRRAVSLWWWCGVLSLLERFV